MKKMTTIRLPNSIANNVDVNDDDNDGGYGGDDGDD